MKKNLLLVAMTLFGLVSISNAQEKIKEVVSAEYDRSSVSYIFVDRNYSSSDVTRFYNDFTVPVKFDANNIKTKFFNTNCLKDGVITDADHLTAVMNEENIGNEVIAFIYNRKSDGTFDETIIKERGLNNATDQDIKNLEAAKVKDQWFEMGEALVNSSYVVVYDISKIESKTDKNGDPSYSVEATAMVFKMKADREVLDNFYYNGWADVTYSAEDKAKAKAAFDNMPFEMEFVASATAYGSSISSSETPASIYEACNDAHESVFAKLEKSVTAWKVATSVVSIKPIAAKIGTKEGIKNADRYFVYTYRENKEGELISVKRGAVRATVVADNSGIATGDTEPTLFYQISGAGNVKEGYTLQENKDLKLGASLAFGISPAGFRVGLDLDYIANMSKRGNIVYGLVNLGLNMADYMLFDASVGAGYGIPLSRYFEVMPYATIGGYYDLDAESIVAYTVEPGARLALTLQPFSLYIGAGYQAFLGGGIGGGVNAKIGFKWTF